MAPLELMVHVLFDMRVRHKVARAKELETVCVTKIGGGSLAALAIYRSLALQGMLILNKDTVYTPYTYFLNFTI